MTLRKTLLALATTTLFAACSPAEVVVTLEIENTDPVTQETTTMALEDVQVRLFPFDRDSIFDMLEAQAETPEPPIPDSVLSAQAAVQAAQQEWQAMQNQWNTLRDSLQTLVETLENTSRASGEYRVLFNEEGAVRRQYEQIDREVNEAFERFTDLQSSSIAAAEAAALAREEWADDAFAEIGTHIDQALEESGRDIQYDTTAATGIARFQVEPGQWWVTARYELPFEELYWNIPLEATRDAPSQIRLTLENAIRRPKL